MRRVIKCNGRQVSGDPRGWYAVIKEEAIDDCTVAVFHPKDVETDPSQALAACNNFQECLDFLIEEEWVDGKTDPEWLPNDHGLPKKKRRK